MGCLDRLHLTVMKTNLYKYENELRSQGVQLIAGVDEVGRGPLIGPVVVCAVVLPADFTLPGLDDSKKLSEKKRLEYNEIILKQALAISIEEVSAKEVDEKNVYQATKFGMLRAINSLDVAVEHVLVDAMPLPELLIPSTSIIKGDSKSITIAAASVVAKVYRDNLMYQLAKTHPEYGFEKHKGYPTKAHLEAIKEHGVLDQHRRSFGPVRDKLQEQLSLFKT